MPAAKLYQSAAELTFSNLVRSTGSSPDVSEMKMHLACWNGSDNPLDIFFEGKFSDWQAEQTKRNFERPYILSLIQLTEPNCWLFAGIYKSMGCEFSEATNCFTYRTELTSALAELVGRLILSFERPGRQSYLLAEKWTETMTIHAIHPEPLSIQLFPGYSNVIISKKTLDTIVRQNIESWRSPLSAVAGVYLIADTATGKLYIGSAVGENGIWQRWTQYSLDGHGGNAGLRSIIQEKGSSYSANFQYTILEISDKNASSESILARESHWKNVLCSRNFGLNKN